MTLVARFNAAVQKLVGPNAAHALDGFVAYAITAIVAALADPSARAYAASHPALPALLAVATPLLTAAASKFRKAATPMKAAPAPASEPPAAPPAG